MSIVTASRSPRKVSQSTWSCSASKTVSASCAVWRKYSSGKGYGGSLCGGCRHSLFNNLLHTSQTSVRKTRPAVSITVRNSNDGNEVTFKGGGRKRVTFRYVCRALDALAQRFGLRVYFVTFTLGSDVSVQALELNRILSFLRMRFKRAGLKFWYSWVIELQHKRYVNTGIAALHWHFAIVAPAGSLPDIEFLKDARHKYHVKCEGSIVSSSELYQFWGRGQVFSCYAWGRIDRYLAKYLTKDDDMLSDGRFPQFDGFRRFGSSQLGRERLPDWAKAYLDTLDADGVPVDDLVVRREGSWLNVYGVGGEVSSMYDRSMLPERWQREGLVRLFHYRSPWRVVSVVYD